MIAKSTQCSTSNIIWSTVSEFITLISTDLKALSDASCCSRGRCVPHSLVAEDVGGELRLGLGDAGSGSSVVAVDLGQNEEVCEGGHDPACRDEDEHEADEVISASGAAIGPGSSGECGDGDDQTAERGDRVSWLGKVRRSLPCAHLTDPESHQHREAELCEEDQEEGHEPHAGVGLEGLVCGAEPAEE